MLEVSIPRAQTPNMASINERERNDKEEAEARKMWIGGAESLTSINRNCFPAARWKEMRRGDSHKTFHDKA